MSHSFFNFGWSGFGSNFTGWVGGQMRSNAIKFPNSDVDIHIAHYLVSYYNYYYTITIITIIA